jgi:tetratricopeptide (TPR) repeat protein
MGGGSREALSLYGKGKWDEAADAMDAYGKGEQGKRRTRALRMAQAMRRVGKALGDGQRAQSTDPGLALKHYQRALAEDRKVGGGKHQQSIRGKLYKVARVRATRLMASKQYERAKSAVAIAAKFGPVDAQLKKVKKELEQKALEIFNKGYALKSSSPQRARAYWKRVLKMVDSKSPAYVKAYSYLNENVTVDEDED